MKSLTILIYFFMAMAFSQEESSVEIQDSPIHVGLFKDITISDNLDFQYGLSIRENIGFHTLEVPFKIKYDLSNKWSTFLGVQTRTVIEANLERYFREIGKPSISYLSIGTEYEFKNNAFGDFAIGFPLGLQLGIKF